MMVAFLYLMLIPFASGSCNFPSDIQGTWMYKDNNDSIITNSYNRYSVKVTSGTLSAVGAHSIPDSIKLYPFTWTCEQENQEMKGKYVVKVNNTGYMCVEFVKRAESVVQMKTTDVKISVEDVSCEEKGFHLDPWPLLRIGWRSSPCPSIGGFWADFYDRNNTFMFGKSRYGSARIEFECTKNEGLFMYTERHNDGQLFKERGKYLGCRGFWTEGKFTFIATGGMSIGNIIVTHNAVIRYNTAQADSDQFDAYIFRDAIAPTTDVPDASYNFIKASLFREKMDSPCVDYRYKDICRDRWCDHHSTDSACAKSCGLCSENSTNYFCQFNSTGPLSKFLGEWMLSSKSDDKMIMNSNLVDFTNYESLHCMQLFRGNNLVKLSSNGCSPRYYCLKMKEKSPSVLAYILSRPIPSIYAATFTFSSDIRFNLFCYDDQYFRYNHDASSLQYFTFDDDIYRIMVNPTDTKSMKCDLEYHLYTTMNISYEVQCDVSLGPENDTTLNMRYSNCTDGEERPNVYYDCLYSKVSKYIQRDKAALWVVMSQDPKTYHCIAISYIYQNDKYVHGLFMAPLDQCMIQENGEFYNRRYAENEVDPDKWDQRWHGSIIDTLVRVESPLETTDNPGMGTTENNIYKVIDKTGKQDTGKAVSIQLSSFLVSMCILYIPYFSVC